MHPRQAVTMLHPGAQQSEHRTKLGRPTTSIRQACLPAIGPLAQRLISVPPEHLPLTRPSTLYHSLLEIIK